MMTEERKAIVAYLRTVASWYMEKPFRDSDGNLNYGDPYDTVTAAADDIEEMHPDTMPDMSQYNKYVADRAKALG